MTYPAQQPGDSVDIRGSVAEYHLGLTCLTTAADQAWLTYAAGEYRGQWVKLPPVGRSRPTWWRYLARDWIYWWTLGLADQHQAGHLIEPLALQPLPELLTLAEAGALLGVRYDRLRGMVRGKELYPLYATYMRMYLIKAQVELISRVKQGKATKQAAARWSAIEAGLPPLIRAREVAEPIRFRATPGQPVPFTGPATSRQGRVCAVGHEQGWWTYRGAVRQRGESATFTLDVKAAGGEVLQRHLAQSATLPYVLGGSERYGASALVAFAENQG